MFSIHQIISKLMLLMWVFFFTVSASSQAATGDDKSTQAFKAAINLDDSVEPELNFDIKEGQIYNKFFRQGKVAAHTLLKSGKSPRLVVAFPAGNSGVSLWFKELEQAIQWQNIEKISALNQGNNDGELLYGIEAKIITNAQQLVVEQAVLSNIRILRDYLHSKSVPSEISNVVTLNKQSVTWYRDRLDGQGGYKLHVDVIQGHVSGGQGDPIVFTAPQDLPLILKIQALSGDKPLTPILKNNLLKVNANENETSKNILAFLSYQEKLLAGSWRFATYFGRDTLMSIRLLMPVLQPAVIEAGLGSVIERLNRRGEVAHEEDISEFAILRHLRESDHVSDHALYDHKMIDDDYLLAPIIAEYLLGQQSTSKIAQDFLQRKTLNDKRYGERLLANFDYVVAMASKYAKSPKVENLISLNHGHTVGQWRDSGEGLGFGRVPYDVNAVFVPAALSAIAQLLGSDVFNDFDASELLLEKAKEFAKVWQLNAPAHFKVTLSVDKAKQAIAEHAKHIGVPATLALSSLKASSLTFNAVSLDEQGKPIAVMNSDDGFALLLTQPSDIELLDSVKTLLRPYPAGLLTPVGMLVANPVYADKSVQQHFTNQHYHGEVIWSWQQALFAAGLERQLLRSDLAKSTRAQLLLAQDKLWRVINDAAETNNAELWSWSFGNGQYQIEAFGQRSGDKTESNAAQLWSTVYLAISSPIRSSEGN